MSSSVAEPPRILVVDDEDTIRETLVEILSEQGYEAVGAVDGVDALERLRATSDGWSAILLDLTMPNMDGRAFREEQLRDPALASIPVIVLSAYRDVAQRVADLAIAACLVKPPTIPTLLAVLAKHRRRAPRR